jgi:hypothetical protein
MQGPGRLTRVLLSLGTRANPAISGCQCDTSTPTPRLSCTRRHLMTTEESSLFDESLVAGGSPGRVFTSAQKKYILFVVSIAGLLPSGYCQRLP